MTVNLQELLGWGPDITVSEDDAIRLWLDQHLYGNMFVLPTGEDDPTHRRIHPHDVTPVETP
jgi:hypothetical protein